LRLRTASSWPKNTSAPSSTTPQTGTECGPEGDVVAIHQLRAAPNRCSISDQSRPLMAVRP